MNRLDEIIIFHPLGTGEIKKIVDMQLDLVRHRLAEKNIKLNVSSEAEDLLARSGFDPLYGARPLKRAIQNMVLDELALRIVEGKIKEGDKVKEDAKGDKIIIH